MDLKFNFPLTLWIFLIIGMIFVIIGLMIILWDEVQREKKVVKRNVLENEEESK